MRSKQAIQRLCLVAALAILTIIIPSWNLRAAEKSLSSAREMGNAFAEVAKKVKPAVVSIRAERTVTVSPGEGFGYLIRHGATQPEYQTFRGEPADLRSLSGIMEDAFSFRPRGIIQLGLLMLIATPVARVVFSVFAFAVQRDLTYVIITLIVLAVLFYSLTGGAL